MADSVIARVPLSEIPEDYVATANMMNRLVGDATTIQVFAHSLPATDFYFKDFYRGLFYNERPGMKLDTRFKQLMRLRLSKRHGCALCNRNNEEEVRQLGFTQAQVDALFEFDPDMSVFSDAELGLIRLADQMILENQDGRLDQQLYDQLRRHFTDEQIVEGAMVAAILVGAAKLTFVLDVVPREATCTMPAPSAAKAKSLEFA